MSRLSIVIPCFESAPLLRETLDSLRAQTRRPDEVIVADDGSAGALTLALLDELETRGWRGLSGLQILREPHRGPGATRNAALRATTGALVLPLDSDDTLAPRALELLEAALLQHPGASFAFCHVTHFGALSSIAVPPRFNPWLQLEDNKLVVTALLRRSMFEEHGVWYPSSREPGHQGPLDGYEDWSFWLDAIERGLTGVCVERPLFNYRRRGGDTGQLNQDNARRAELKGELRRRHPAVYTAEAQTRIKERFAPALELLCSGDPGDIRITSFLRGQSLDDVTITARPFVDARALLREARGKHLLWIEPSHLPLLARAPPSLLEQLVRCLEKHGHDVLVVPTDVNTLQAGSNQPRLLPAATSVRSSDLVLLRTDRASSLLEAHLPPGIDPRALAGPSLRRGRGLSLCEDFFALTREPPPGVMQISPTAQPARSRSPLPDGWRRARRLAERLAGAERLGALLHPLKEKVADWSWRLDAASESARSGNLPRGCKPILAPSQRMERRLLDSEPVRYARRGPLVDASGRKRVLAVLPWLTRGGVERAILQMAAALPRDRCELLCATSRESAHEWAGRMRALSSDLLLLGETTPEKDQPAAVLQLLRDRQVDALFTVNSWLGLETARLARAELPSLRTIDYQHTDLQTPGADFARQSCLRFDRFLDLRLVSTEHLRERYRAYGVDPAKVRLVRAGCDEALFDPEKVAPGSLAEIGIPPGAKTVGFIGRLVEEKDPAFVARVYAALDERAGPLHFIFLGEGPQRGAIEEVLRPKGLLPRTRFLAGDTNIAAALRDLTLTLMAPRTEGLPLVFFESLSMRVPVVSTAMAGIPELIDGEVGACVPDAPDDSTRLNRMVEAALPFLQDERRRLEAGSHGRERIINDFSASQTAADYRSAFEWLFRDVSS